MHGPGHAARGARAAACVHSAAARLLRDGRPLPRGCDAQDLPTPGHPDQRLYTVGASLTEDSTYGGWGGVFRGLGFLVGQVVATGCHARHTHGGASWRARTQGARAPSADAASSSARARRLTDRRSQTAALLRRRKSFERALPSRRRRGCVRLARARTSRLGGRREAAQDLVEEGHVLGQLPLAALRRHLGVQGAGRGGVGWGLQRASKHRR